MPELPEVETTRRGLFPLRGRTIRGVTVRQRRLRWPIASGLERAVAGATVTDLRRRAKYVLIETDRGTLIVHLGMSGTLLWCEEPPPPAAHDHVDFHVAGAVGAVVRYRDPRRFGSIHWTKGDVERHRLLCHLGPEPLEDGFDGAHLHRLSRGKNRASRDFLLDGRVVAGVGNIYANEALFVAGVRPGRAAGRVGRASWDRVAVALREILADAVAAGGTTLRDYRGASGESGEYSRSLGVYGRDGEKCSRCSGVVRRRTRGGRSMFYCPDCQH